jgi:hypothetical protein
MRGARDLNNQRSTRLATPPVAGGFAPVRDVHLMYGGLQLV